jgi:hypothetical protein
MRNSLRQEETQGRGLPRLLTIGAPLIAFAIFMTALVIYFYNFGGPLSQDHGKWGQFGDFLGGAVNPFLGFLSLIVLLATLVIQSRELHNSTIELAKSTEALQHQNDALIQQNFENTFFQMARRISDIVNGTRYHVSIGREAFRLMYQDQLRDTYHKPYEGFPTEERARAVNDTYEKFYEVWRGELGHYFRSLYHTFKFIDQSHLSEKGKSVYANIVRAQLSTYELTLLFYNCLWGEGKEGFKPLVEKYGILKHINEGDLLNPYDKENKLLYRPTAFMGRGEREEFNALTMH